MYFQTNRLHVPGKTCYNPYKDFYASNENVHENNLKFLLLLNKSYGSFNTDLTYLVHNKTVRFHGKMNFSENFQNKLLTQRHGR